jgi:hypothetical protein
MDDPILHFTEYDGLRPSTLPDRGLEPSAIL